MAKDITLKNGDGSVIYYPKTVSELVYDNETGETLKEQVIPTVVSNKTHFFNGTVANGSISSWKYKVLNQMVNKIFIDTSGYTGDAADLEGGIKISFVNIGNYTTDKYYFGFRVTLISNANVFTNFWDRVNSLDDAPDSKTYTLYGIYIYVEWNWAAVKDHYGEMWGITNDDSYILDLVAASNPHNDPRIPITEAKLSSEIQDKLDNIETNTTDINSLSESVSSISEKVNDLYIHYPINDIKNINSTSISFAPLGNATEGTHQYGCTVVEDTESPFKDIIGYYSVISETKTSIVSSFIYEFGSGTSASRTSRPQKIEFSMWLNKNDFSSVSRSFPLVSIENRSIKTDMTALPIRTALNTGVGYRLESSRSVDGLFTCDYYLKVVANSGDWYQVIFEWDNIVWVDVNWQFCLTTNGIQTTYEQIRIVNPQIVLDDEIPSGIVVLPDNDSVEAYPTTKIGNIEKDVAQNGEDIQSNREDIDMILNTIEVKSHTLHYDSADDATSYILSPFNDTYNLKMTFAVSRSGGYLGDNICFNFKSMYLVSKSNGNEVSVDSMPDDICPSNFNASYIGANHGHSDIRAITCANHGKTVADIGSIWENSSTNKQATIIGILDENTLIMLGENKATYPGFSFEIPRVFGTSSSYATLAHVSGATHTDSIAITNVEMKQWKPSVIVQNIKLIADGVEITESGDYSFNHLDICETYDIPNVADVLSIIQQNVGTYTANPTPNQFATADKVARHSIVYGFDGAADWKCSTDFIAYQDFYSFGYFGFTQQIPLVGSDLKMYIPKALPISNGSTTLDFRTIAPHNSVPSTMNITSSYWENPNLPPDRWLQFSENIGLHSGYLFDYGVGGTNRKNCISNAFFLSTSRKCYPHGVDSKVTISAGDCYSAVVWRKYIDRSKINQNGVIATNVFEYDNKCYIYADYNASGYYEIDIPSKWVGKSIDVFEKSDNLTLYNQISSNKILVKVDTASPMYAYMVAQIKG